jgi:hypothetical protein
MCLKMTFGILTIHNTSRDIKRQQKKSIICFKIKNPPTLHSKKRGYERKLLTVVLVVVVFFKFFEAGNERSF